MENNAIKFPQNIDRLLNIMAKECKIKIAKETHYDAINRVLFWFEGKIRKRIDFTFIEDTVDVTFYKDTFPFSPKFLIGCHNIIPMFPLYAKTKWKTLDKLLIDESEEFYREKVESYIENARGE